MPIMAEDRIADRSRAIEAALLNIEKRFGKGSIMRLGEREVSDIPAISTTSLSLDAAIGVKRQRRRRDRLMRRLASAACRVDVSWKFTGRRVPARPPSPCTLWPKHKGRVEWQRTSTLNMQWMPTTLPSWA